MKHYETPKLNLTFWSADVITYSTGTKEITEDGMTDYVVNANPGWIH